MERFRIKRLAVTGATGAIGLALLDLCIRQGIEVYAVVNPASGRIQRLPEHELVHIVPCDMYCLERLGELIPSSVDAFCHLAWASTTGQGRNNTEAQWRNIGAALDAVNVAAALGSKVFVGAGSQAEYGRVSGKLSPDTPAFPENAYGSAKLCAGQLTRIRCEQLGLRHVWARILSVYGPGDGENTMVMSVIRQLLEGKVPELTKGEQMWDYLYSRDAAQALLLLGEKGKHGRIYCLGSGSVQPLREYVKTIRDIAAPGRNLEFGSIPYGENQVMYLCADLRELQGDTGFVPEYAFEEGIKETLSWVRQHNKIKDSSQGL